MSLFNDLLGTLNSYFKLGKNGVRLKDAAGNLAVRTSNDSGDASITASSLNLSGDSLIINADASESGNDWSTTIQRSPTQTQPNVFTLPENDGSPGQVLTTNGSGALSFVSIGGTADKATVDTTSLTFGSTTTVSMFTLPANAVIEKVRLILDTPFNGTTPTATVGYSGQASILMGSAQNDLKGLSGDSYETYPYLVPSGSTRDLEITYAASGSTAGAARILVFYSIPS